MWTKANRGQYDRSKLRYLSDLTDEEWRLVEPLIPPAKRGGCPRKVKVRDVVDGLMYILSTGCQWRYTPAHFPPSSTLYHYFDLWSMMVRWIIFIIFCMRNAVFKRNER
jgi:transposase